MAPGRQRHPDLLKRAPRAGRAALGGTLSRRDPPADWRVGAAVTGFCSLEAHGADGQILPVKHTCQPNCRHFSRPAPCLSAPVSAAWSTQPRRTGGLGDGGSRARRVTAHPFTRPGTGAADEGASAGGVPSQPALPEVRGAIHHRGVEAFLARRWRLLRIGPRGAKDGDAGCRSAGGEHPRPGRRSALPLLGAGVVAAARRRGWRGLHRYRDRSQAGGGGERGTWGPANQPVPNEAVKGYDH